MHKYPPGETRIVALPGAGESYSFRLPAHRLGEILSPAQIVATEPVEGLVQRALTRPVGSAPLAQLIRPRARVLVIVDDITRTTPTARIVPLVLAALHDAGCRDDEITFAMALGTHRPMTTGEIFAKLGPDIPARFSVINTPAQERDAFVAIGESWDDVPIEVHRAVLDADVVIGIGSVVPHGDAGWSGGCKIVLPGMCSERTVRENHVLAARFPGNALGEETTPVRLNMEGVVAKIGLDFVVNVVMTPWGEVLNVFGGHFVAAQRAAVVAARAIYCVPFQEYAEIVVANAYPAEIDLWQASKGIWAGDLLARTGGTVILHAPCPEGIGPHPEYLRYMQCDPDDLLRRLDAGEPVNKGLVGGTVPIGRMLQRIRMIFVSPGLRHEDFGHGPIRYCSDLQTAVDDCLATAPLDARLSVITHAGYVFPVHNGVAHD